MNVTSPRRPEKLFVDAPGRLQNAFTKLPRCPPAAFNTPRNRKKIDKMVQEALKMCEKLSTTLPRHPNTPPNDTQDASKTLQNDSKTPWDRLKFNHVERLTHRTQMKKTNLHPFEVFKSQPLEHTSLLCWHAVSFITTILQQPPTRVGALAQALK